MLEHVAVGQSRFMTPGIAPDPRGIALGRYGMLLFPTLEGVVSWFRLYSAESSLDELLPGMAILRVRTPLQSREMVVRIPATSSYALDRAARCARLVGGSTFTGTSKHFVKFRDDRSPYGYDAIDIKALPKDSDFMLHSDDFQQTYVRDGELSFEKLLYRLSLRRVPGGKNLRADQRAELLLVIARGLGDGVIRYLWRNRVAADMGLAQPKGDSAFSDGSVSRGYLIARVRDVPARILDLFLLTPGVDVFRLIVPNVAIQVGYNHVIDLSSCASVFTSASGDESNFYLFWGDEDRVDLLDGPLELSGVENLTRVQMDVQTASDKSELKVEEAEPIGVRIRLAASLSSARRVIGTLIPLNQAGWLKRLVYVLPQGALRGHRIAVSDRGLLLVGHEDIDLIPLGQLLSELAPGLLVPVGMDLVPRVAPDVLSRALGHGKGMLTVFPHDGQPFQVEEASLVPLERKAVAKIEVTEAIGQDTHLQSVGDPTVINEDVGRFALWGFSGGDAKKLLPKKSDD